MAGDCLLRLSVQRAYVRVVTIRDVLGLNPLGFDRRAHLDSALRGARTLFQNLRQLAVHRKNT